MQTELASHLLRWHNQQVVLANMKRPDEPIFEVDFPPGSDIVDQIHILAPSKTLREKYFTD